MMAVKPDVETNSLNSYRRSVINVFHDHFARLVSAMKGCVKEFAEKAYEANLICTTVMKDEDCTSIYLEFKTVLEFCDSVSQIRDKCECFIQILKGLSGAARMAGECFEKKLPGHLSGMCILSLSLDIYTHTHTHTHTRTHAHTHTYINVHYYNMLIILDSLSLNPVPVG